MKLNTAKSGHLGGLYGRYFATVEPSWRDRLSMLVPACPVVYSWTLIYDFKNIWKYDWKSFKIQRYRSKVEVGPQKCFHRRKLTKRRRLHCRNIELWGYGLRASLLPLTYFEPGKIEDVDKQFLQMMMKNVTIEMFVAYVPHAQWPSIEKIWISGPWCGEDDVLVGTGKILGLINFNKRSLTENVMYWATSSVTVQFSVE